MDFDGLPYDDDPTADLVVEHSLQPRRRLRQQWRRAMRKTGTWPVEKAEDPI